MLLNCLSLFLIHLKLELQIQFLASNVLWIIYHFIPLWNSAGGVFSPSSCWSAIVQDFHQISSSRFNSEIVIPMNLLFGGIFISRHTQEAAFLLKWLHVAHKLFYILKS